MKPAHLQMGESLKRNIGVAVLGLAVLLAGCSAEAQNTPVPDANQETKTSATPGQTQESLNTVDLTKKQKDVVESGLFEGLSPEKKAEIKSLRNMTVEQFRQQPLEQQLVFARYVYDNNAPRTLHAMKGEGFDFEAYANRVVEPSETSTAQQVVDSAAIAIDVAGNLYNEKVEYDVDTARKMLVLSAEPSTALFDVYDKDLQTRATGLASSTTTEIRASKLYKTENGTQMKVNLISHGDLVQGTYKLVQYKGIDGEPLKTWQMNFGVSQKSPQFDYTVK